MLIYYSDIDDTFCVGDIHGNFDGTLQFIERNDFITNCNLIFCGDIGIGFKSAKDEFASLIKLNTLFFDRNINGYFFRGNHDNKDRFHGDFTDGLDNLFFIPDYSIVKTPNKNILCCGGAISIDRQMRITNDIIYKTTTYWEDEINYYDEDALKEITDSNININFVCTHTAPTFAEPNSFGGIVDYYSSFDNKLKDDLKNERSVCDKIYDYLINNGHRVEKWLYGHFHTRKVVYIDNIKFVMLDMYRDNKLDMEML